ncbi:hypothetical protein [Olleya sp. R77988]|uniref:hypothetical protein n=1 Tax=Olleya sp. R77988 TaxID=3093875 RepID=UPI0037CC5310
MENKKQKIKKLIKRNEELKPIVFVSFKTDKELDLYRKKIHKERVEYFNNQKQIQQLEWDLMTPEEQAKEKKRDRFLELKAKGEPFDLSEFEDL